MNQNEAIKFLSKHSDGAVRLAAGVLQTSSTRRIKVLGLVQEALSQVRLDMKYMLFDLEATRRERDAAQA